MNRRAQVARLHARVALWSQWLVLGGTVLVAWTVLGFLVGSALR